MKYLIFFLILLISCNNKSETKKDVKKAIAQQALEAKAKTNIDSIKASKALAIVKAKLLKPGIGNKYLHAQIQILEILVNKTGYDFPESINVAHYSWKSGIPPNKECVIYLTLWPFGSSKLNEKQDWMLIEGDGEYACECK